MAHTVQLVASVYCSDIEAPTMQTQLGILSTNTAKKINIHDVIAYVQMLSSAEQELLLYNATRSFDAVKCSQ